tara:strand:- start:761 stop:2419 length:1659 start_codon:yes stop_codon:yes gene_type:complete
MKKAIYAFLFSIMFVLSGCYGNGGGAGDDTDNEDEVVEVFGCIDETAINFNPEANTDDSSCAYIITPPADLNATIHFGEEYGKIAPIHGVNNGPLVRKAWGIEGCQSVWYGSNQTDEYSEMQIPSSRTHGEGAGDMNRIWIHADENGIPVYEGYDPLDSSNYNFTDTDQRVQAAEETTHTSTYWRLGYPKAFPAYPDCPDWRSPPDNFTVFAQAAVQVLKHYRQGWNDGFYFDSFDVVEVWNEPYLTDFWTGTADEYYELFHAVNSAVIEEFGDDIDVVAAITLGANSIAFSERFMELAQQNNEPINSVYAHLYRINPSQTAYFFVHETESIGVFLAKYGYSENTPVYITEWNRNIPVYAQSPASQSYLTSVLTIYNDLWEGNKGNSSYDVNTLRMAHFFAARSFFWEENGRIKPPGITWTVYSEMVVNTPIRLQNEGGFPSQALNSNEFNILAGKSENGSQVNILLSRYVDENASQPNGFSEYNDTVNLSVDGLNASCAYTWKHWGMVDNQTEPWQLIAEGDFTGAIFEMSHFEMNQRSFHFIQLDSPSSC